MRAWGGVVGGLVLGLLGCGQGTGASGLGRAGQTEGAADAGQTSCTSSGAIHFANAGTGSACSTKPVLGPPITFTSDVADAGQCSRVAPADGNGDLLVASSAPSGTETVRAYRSDGTPYAQRVFDPIEGQLFLPLSAGWFLVAFIPPSGQSFGLIPYTDTLQPQGERNDPTRSFAYPDQVTRSPGGGAAAVGGLFVAGNAPCSPAQVHWILSRFDASGARVASADLGCVEPQRLPVLGVNAAGDVVLLAGTQGFHLDPAGALTTFTYPSGDPDSIFPLANGSFAVAGPGGKWQFTVRPSGETSPPPCWLTSRTDVTNLQVVQRGAAYLVTHGPPDGVLTTSCDGYLEYVLPDGTSCGNVPLPRPGACGPATVTLGLDGTLAKLDTTSCTVRSWPRLFAP